MENVGYDGKAVDVKPYAITKYNFIAQFNEELGFSEGKKIKN